MSNYNLVNKIILCFVVLFSTQSYCADQKTTKHSASKVHLVSNVKKHAEPALFRFKKSDGRYIYILATHHSVPLKNFFATQTLDELSKIADERPIFYTEHAVDNKLCLSYLQSGDETKFLIPKQTKLNLFTMLEKQGINISLNHDEQQTINTGMIMKDFNEPSSHSFSEILNMRVLLAAVTLSNHVGLLYYNKFGGTEHDLEEIYRDKWLSVEYLETPEEVFNIMEKHKVNEQTHNINWMKKNLKKLLLLKHMDQDYIEKELKNEQDVSINTYDGWIILKRDLPLDGPIGSTVERNKLWVEKIIKASNTTTAPLLIVVGTGHLAGGKNNSFLWLLMNGLRINDDTLETFSNVHNKWVSYS